MKKLILISALLFSFNGWAEDLICTKIDKYNDDLNNIADRNRENLVEIESIQKEIDNLVKTIDEEGPKNQVIRVASWFKDFFVINYENENNKIAKQINDLESSKVFNTILFFKYKTERTDKEVEIINNQISMLSDQVILNEQKLELSKAK